jgi:hypothetical protein
MATQLIASMLTGAKFNANSSIANYNTAGVAIFFFSPRPRLITH